MVGDDDEEEEAEGDKEVGDQEEEKQEEDDDRVSHSETIKDGRNGIGQEFNPTPNLKNKTKQKNPI